MALYVAALPRFTAADAQWIEQIRRRHDPQAGLIAAHLTLVFAASGVGTAAAERHLRAIASRTERVAVTFDAVALRAGMTDADIYAYLLPGPGTEALMSLHERLHGGLFAGHDRLPFEPHVTLGRSPDRESMARLVDGLARRRLAIEATVDALTLLEVDGAIKPQATFAFA